VAAQGTSAGEYEVRGERYAVLASAEGYREMGLASWYGEDFAGKPTANGEIYDPDGLTAAHRSLPLSTWVEVTNLSNGKKVTLRVNDRGPFRDTHLRIIDVSHAAARELGIIGLGLARVEIVALPTGLPPGN
jgi:rare lipoprotein A